MMFVATRTRLVYGFVWPAHRVLKRFTLQLCAKPACAHPGCLQAAYMRIERDVVSHTGEGIDAIYTRTRATLNVCEMHLQHFDHPTGEYPW